MRFLFSLIATSFFFMASLQSHAENVVSKSETENSVKKSSPANAIEFLSGEHAATIAEHRNNTNSHYRSFPHTDLLATADQKNRVNNFSTENYCTTAYLFCKRIGLKLLFPKHYHW